MKGQYHRRHAAGFTLLEVLTAVAILALAMTALIAWAAQSADRTGLLREKAIANWVAHNKLTELHLADTWPNTGNSNGNMEMAGQEWSWRLEVKKTPDDRIRRVDVFVDSPNSRGQLLVLSGFLPPKPLSSGNSVSATLRQPGTNPENNPSDLNPDNNPAPDQAG